MTSYLAVILLFFLPVLVNVFTEMFFNDSQFRRVLPDYLFTSPFMAAFSLPLTFNAVQSAATGSRIALSEATTMAFFWFYVTLDLVLIWMMLGLFKTRWRVAW